MTEQKLRLGLVGRDVTASESERIHSFILRAFGVGVEYENFSVSAEDFDGTARVLLGDFDGFNITVPYKRDIMEYLDGVVGDAAKFGAVNTVVCATRLGYNTDGLGFMQALKLHGVAVDGKSVLVLGGGGAGRSSAAVLKRMGARVSMYRRNRAELKEACEQLGVTAADDPECGGYDILVNATGVGMHESVGQSPVRQKAFCGASVAIDLIYRPSVSEFLRLAKAQGLQTVSGGAMLFLQAYYADCLFLGKSPDEREAESLYRKYQKQESSL